MNEFGSVAKTKEVAVSLIRSPQSLDLVKELYQKSVGKEKKVLTSFFLQPNQKAIINGLSEMTGKAQADVLRDIIDEWCEQQLRDSGQ